ncbi:MAG TPA: nitrilase-related carbon-nitrogen hydrolase, partial [Steroidobacteraceae bacterium]
MVSIASTEPVKVAALQMTSAADVALNLDVAAQLLAEARTAGARVAVLPENFSFMGMRDIDKRTVAEADGD